MKAVLLFPLVLLPMWACIPNDGTHGKATTQLTSTAEPGVDTAEAYRTAIAEYIKVMSKRDGAFTDTLYIGRHVEFPDIQLPAIIESRQVRIVRPTEAEVLKDAARFTFLNIFGWFDHDTVQFKVITFGQHMHHWPDGRDDCDVYLSMRGAEKRLALDSLKF